MNGRTLASIFATIPSTIHFPWVSVEGNQIGGTSFDFNDEDDEDAGLRGMMPNSSDDDEGHYADEPATFGGLEGVAVEGAVDIRAAELAAIEAKARAAHGQQLLDSIEGAKAVAQAMAQRSRAATNTSGGKRPRMQGGRVDRSDPDVKKLEALIESNAAMVSSWEAKRSALTADEQEALLLVPGDSSKKVSGSVCLFHDQKGYGFIAPDCGGPDIYFTRDSVTMSDSVKELVGDVGLSVGERVTFGVSLNDSHSSRRLKAEGVTAERANGEPNLAVALKGSQMTGKIRNFNVEGNRGYIQSSERDQVDELSADPVSTLYRCHKKGIVDAVFTLTNEQINSGIVPANGLQVTYYLMPSLDLKSGRAVAVGCSFAQDAATEDDIDKQGGDLLRERSSFAPGRSSNHFRQDSAGEPQNKKNRVEVQQSQVQPAASASTPQVLAPKLLLLETDDAW